jgi:hypothetical protein
LLEQTTTTAGQIPERLQLHSLLLPDGRLAHTLDRDALYRELKVIGLQVDPRTGHQALLAQYHRHLYPPAAGDAKAGGITTSKGLGVT